MRRKLFRLLPVLLVPAVMLVATSGCKKDVVDAEVSYELNDVDVYPEQKGPYADEVAEVLSSYKNSTLSAEKAAAQLFAYACYSEEYLDSYAYFSYQGGETDYGKSGTSSAVKQDYKLIVNGDTEEEGGFKFHYTIKHVNEASGLLSAVTNLFESAKLRIVDEDTLLYRLEGENVEYGDDGQTLVCDWVVKSTESDWGVKDDYPIVKRAEKLDLDGIASDIVDIAENDTDNMVIHGNINILADNIVEFAEITEDTVDGHTVYTVEMTINTEVANADASSIAMLGESNGASSCSWTDYTIYYKIWDNGLFYYYMLVEGWKGKISGFSGEVGSLTYVRYSYSAEDTDTTDKKAFLEKAKQEHG